MLNCGAAIASVPPFFRVMGYADAQEGAFSRTAFRSTEKAYKRYTHVSSAKSRNQHSRRAQVPATDVSKVLDFKKLGEDGEYNIEGVSRVEGSGWPVYTIDKHPGFYFIPEALNKAEQLYWATECLTTFPQPPNRTNHNAMYGPIANLWAAFQENKILVEVASGKQERDLISNSAETRSVDEKISDSIESVRAEVSDDITVVEKNRFHDNGITTSGGDGGNSWEFRDCSTDFLKTSSAKTVSSETLVRKLRWATVGIQFDWSKRAYNEALPFQEIPPKLADLARRLAKPAMENEDFKAEAAIVNFYGPDDMLGGHVDDMEADMSKPIVSISLGCKAIFLLGGTTRDEPPAAMFVRSGDVVLMAGPARHCFHGVPRIFSEAKESELPDFTSMSDVDGIQPRSIVKYLESSRINVNIRQVH
ncbi:DNA N(6)-methyladenine demethylase ALKBH1A isoform X2 [Physcomitrium patens]|uniref:Fe2OG dioxygenase domain-containing protein n=1 Tax=Physcomitrium patens TaxID=3218 RepID=A0A7I4AX33_PHYPA|nr:alpha-ketoglutarate-dependent dioxygenase alkB-like isoform X2 [Physcomitrium patens]|eukprot:XP_024396772.1 alpha-ketoglutarate-dependent dioxygenase alkB-like isoform X2 [Physcomitrella patens]